MQIIPLLFFGILFVFLLIKKGIDVSTFICFLYVITSFFSVQMFEMDLVEPAYRNPSLTATIIYCLLLSVPIIVIYRMDFGNLNYRYNKKCINILSIFYFMLFVFFLILYAKDIIFVMTFGDMGALRREATSGIGVTGVTTYTGALKYLSMFISIMATASFIMILFFFISVVYLHNKWYFNLMILLASTTSVLQDVLNISRSGIFYYVTFLALALSLFWKKMSKKTRSFLTPVFVCLLLGFGFYFMTVTEDRFDKKKNSYGNSINGLISYAGMPYNNFCYFFDYYNNPSGISTRYLLPTTNYLINGFRGGAEREIQMEELTHFNTVAFMTYLGSFIMDCNQMAPFVFIAIYIYLMYVVARRRRKGPYSESWIIFIFVLLSIPAIGILTYYYTNPFRHLALALLFYICNRFNYRKRDSYGTAL